MTGKYPILVFDINETLLSFESLESFFAKYFDDKKVLRQWFSEQILYSQALTLSRNYYDFGELATSVLQMVAELHNLSLNDRVLLEFKQLLGQLLPYPEVEKGLEMLKQSGFRMIALTNSPTLSSQVSLERSGLRKYFEKVISVEEVQQYKPAPATYRRVRELIGFEEKYCMIACHIWDLLGAQSENFDTAFIKRQGNATLPNLFQANFVADDLQDLSKLLIKKY